jgi:hypothetical protein
MVGVGKLFGAYTESRGRLSHRLQHAGAIVGHDDPGGLIGAHRLLRISGCAGRPVLQGKPLRLLVLLGTITTFLSMFLDNVTTVVLIAPVTILISEVFGLNPIPFLLSEALLSNTGGVATLGGRPAQCADRLGSRVILQ